MAFSWAYANHAHPPYWGPVSSQANFCEEDYILTAYIAELINTLTNITYRTLSLLLTLSPRQLPSHSTFSVYYHVTKKETTRQIHHETLKDGNKKIKEKEFWLIIWELANIVLYAYHGIKNNSNRKDAILRNLPYLGIAGVGIGSAIFHATLKNYTQWCDDLSMLIATATVLHRVFTFDKSLSTTVIGGIGITAVMTIFSTWHCVTDEIIMHSVLFGIMIALVGIKTRSIISARVSDREVRKEVKKLATWGSVIFVSGFVIWNIDNAICSSLTTWKRGIGMPWAFLLELHGWWHIFTGAGAYIFIALVEYLTSEEAGQPLGSRFAWPVGLIVNGHAGKKVNGGAKLNGHGNGNANANGEVKLNGVNGNGVNGNAKKTL